MSPHKIIIGLLAMLLAVATWTGTAGLAHAGGPTSVLISSPTVHRAAGLYYTETRYEELVQAVGGGPDQPSSSFSQPSSVDLDDEMVVRLTWMIHDVSVWRIDGIYITQSDGIWISTLIDQGTGNGNLRDRPGRWHRPQNDAALLAVLTSAGILTSSAAPKGDSSPQASPAATTAVAAGNPNPPQTPAGTVAVVAALAGLVLGAAGLMLRRTRQANRPI